MAASDLDDCYTHWKNAVNSEVKEALNCLMAQVLAFARARLDEDSASDAARTILSKLEMFQLRHPSAFSRWCTSIVAKYRLKKGSERTFNSLDEDTVEMAAATTEDGDSTSISELNPFQAQVATAILQGYSLKEIAAQLNMKESTLRKKLFDSRNEKHPNRDI